MLSTKITIKPHLSEYIYAKYNCAQKDAIAFSDMDDIYHLIWQLMIKRPKNVPMVDTGNLNIALPYRRIGKDPMTYNYISLKGAKIIQKKIQSLFNLELHTRMDSNAIAGFPYTNYDVANIFLSEFAITSISADAIIKSYYRYRNKVRAKDKREYKKNRLTKHPDMSQQCHL